MMNFKQLLLLARSGEQAAQERLVRMYDPLLSSAAWHDGFFDEDLYQELRIVLLKCIQSFPL